jgi:hypothetical protein
MTSRARAADKATNIQTLVFIKISLADWSFYAWRSPLASR